MQSFLKSSLPLLLLFAAVGQFTVPVAAQEESKLNKPPRGFKALFNGQDLEGWKGLVGNPKSRARMTTEQLAEAQEKADANMREHWQVQDGVIVFDGKGKSLCTARDYADFEMYVDWKIKEKGDSGIYLRGSPQVQIWDVAANPVGSGGLYNNKANPDKPLVAADKPVGEWNTFYIKMIGDRVTIKLNGTLVVDNVMLENYWERDKPIYSSGQIELQNHGNTLYFRNIFVRELVSTEQLAKMEEAAPTEKKVEAKQARNVLAFYRHHGFRHNSIPHTARAVELMGRSSGAFSTLISDDLTLLTPDNIKQFDGIVLCNTTGAWITPRAEDLKKLGETDAAALEERLHKSLLDFVNGGGGLAGFHSSSDSNYHWPAFGKLIGGWFNHHPWHEEVGIKLETPDHPLLAVFEGKDFSITDEIYQFKDPYSRDNLKVLLKLDTERTNMEKRNINRTDGDFAVAWVRNQGKGRVFYSSLGHREEIWWNPTIMQFYLDGIQFALGDLDADATPSGEVASK